MRYLGNGQYEIQNTQTGEKKIVGSNELAKYGLSAQAQGNASVAQLQSSSVLGNILGGIGRFIAPTTANVVQDVNASGQTGNFVSKTDQNTNDLISSYLALKKANQTGKGVSQAYQASKDVSGQPKTESPQFSSDINKSYLDRGIGVGGELGPLLYGLKGGFNGLSGMKSGAITGGIMGLTNTGKSAEERVMGGVTGAAGGAVVGKTFDVLSGILSKGQGLLNKGKQAVSEKAVEGFTKATPTAYRKGVESGKDINAIAKKYVPAGSDYDSLLGNTSTKGRGGLFGRIINDSEKTIKATVDASGNNIKIGGNDLITALKSEAKKMTGELGGGSRKAAIKEIIKQAENKYKNGITVKQAVNILRQANEKFGKNILDVSAGDAVATSAQKLEGNVLRTTLKKMFPSLKEALDTQSEIYTIRPLINQARATLNTQGSGIRLGKLASVNPLNPLSYGGVIDAAVQNPAMASKLFNPSQTATAGLGNIPSKISPILTNLITGQKPQPQTNQQEVSTPDNNQGGNDIGGQNNQQPSIQQNYLTGHSPEEHYQAYQNALANGDKKAAEQIRQAYTDETAYQKANKSKGGGLTNSIDMMEKLYGAGKSDSLSMGKNTVGLGGLAGRASVEVKKQTDQNFADKLNSYKTQMALVAGAINQAAGAGVLNGGEYERLAMKSFPNEYTSEKVAKDWFKNAREVLNSLPPDRAATIESLLSGQQ